MGRSTVVAYGWSSLAPSLTVNTARTAPFFLTVEKTAADLICVTLVEPPDAVTMGPDQRCAAYLVAEGIDATGPPSPPWFRSDLRAWREEIAPGRLRGASGSPEPMEIADNETPGGRTDAAAHSHHP
jgi:hypothetical protein